MGLAAMVNGGKADQAQYSNELKQAHGAVLNNIIKKDELSNMTLQLLLQLCFEDVLAEYCNQSTLLDKQLEQDSENINSYLMPLKIAIDQDDSPLIFRLLQLMSAAKHSQLNYFITPEFDAAIDSYIEANPIPASYITAFKDDEALLSGIDKKGLDQKIKNYFPTSIKQSYVFLKSLPEFRPLYELCKGKVDLLENCLKITQILINHSDSMVAKGMGYSMLMSIHEGYGKTELFETVKAKHDAYKAQIMCLSKASQSTNFMADFLDPEYQRISLLPTNEFEKMQQMANFIYNKYKDVNPNLIDPKSCNKNIEDANGKPVL
jgi:hypothetical protein